MCINADIVYLLKTVGELVALEQRYITCTLYVSELEVSYCADEPVYGQFGQVHLFLKYLKYDHGEKAYEEVRSDSVGALQIDGACVEEGFGSAEQVLDLMVERAGAQYVDGVIVKRGAVGIEAVKAGFVFYHLCIERHRYVFGGLSVFGDVYG